MKYKPTPKEVKELVDRLVRCYLKQGWDPRYIRRDLLEAYSATPDGFEFNNYRVVGMENDTEPPIDMSSPPRA